MDTPSGGTIQDEKPRGKKKKKKGCPERSQNPPSLAREVGSVAQYGSPRIKTHGGSSHTSGEIRKGSHALPHGEKTGKREWREKSEGKKKLKRGGKAGNTKKKKSVK